jgi:membrane protein YqaA with SNARE-associated domain
MSANNTVKGNESTGTASPKKGIFRRLVVPALTILLVIGITVGLFLLNKTHPDLVERFKTLGYAGIFVVSLLSCATVVLPIPGVFVFVPVLAQFDPVLVGVVGAAGGTIGEITGYMAGYSGQGLAGRGKTYTRVEGWMKRRGGWVVFLLSLLFLVDVAGVVAGALKYPVWKFMLLVWVGKTIKYAGIMLLIATWGWDFITRWLGG